MAIGGRRTPPLLDHAALMLRRIGLLLLWAVALLGLAIAATFAFAQTGPGKRLIAEQIGRALTSADTTVRLEGLQGLVPFDMRLQRLRMADTEGPWLELDDARFSWSPAALLRGRGAAAGRRA